MSIEFEREKIRLEEQLQFDDDFDRTVKVGITSDGIIAEQSNVKAIPKDEEGTYKEIAESIVAAGFSKSIANKLLEALKNDLIEHVKIEYKYHF